MSPVSGARRRSVLRLRSALFFLPALGFVAALYDCGDRGAHVGTPPAMPPAVVRLALHPELEVASQAVRAARFPLVAFADQPGSSSHAPLGTAPREAPWPPQEVQAAAPPRDTVWDEGIMELVADRLPPTTVVVLIDSAGSVLLPLEHVMYFLGLGRTAEARDIRVPRIGGAVARVDTASLTITFPSHTLQLAPAEMPRRGDVVFMRVEHLGTLIESAINVDMSTLTVTFSRDVPFPAQQRIIAEQRRAMVIARQRWLEQRQERTNVPYQSLTGGAVADWEVVTGSLNPAQLTVMRARGGVAVLGGDLGGGGALEVGRTVDDRFRDLSLHYQRVFPRSRWLTQIRLGDVITTGLFSRQIRGLELSNRPFLRSTQLSSVLLQPDLPPGWEYEVFEGNQLLGYSTVGTSEAVSVPLRSGTTPLQVRMYGPAGEEIVQTLLYQAPVSLLPDRVTEYSVGGGRCVTGCDDFLHADLRHGVSSLFTAGAGVELVDDSAGTAARPYFVFSASSGTRVTAELTYMPFSLYSANVAVFPREGSALYLRGNVARPGFGPISLASGTDMRWDTEITWDERIERAAFFSQLRLGVSSTGSLGELQRLRLSATGAFRSGYLEARYDHDDTPSQRHLLTTRAAVFTPFRLGSRTVRPLVSTAVGIADSGIRLAEAALSLQPTTASLVTAGLQWNRGSSQPNVTLGYSVRTSAALAALRVVSTAGGNRSSSASFSGSTAITPDGDVAFHPATRTGYAGVSGRVFIDHDGDGALSAGDEPLGDVHLIVADQRVVSRDDGSFHAWGLQPYQPTVVALDSTRTPDPSLTTVRQEMIVRPVPNMARPIDIPLVRTREVLGSVEPATPDLPIGSLTVELTHLDSGETVTSTTFSDGFFYISRLRPGRYRLHVSPASLQAIGAVAGPAIDFEVPAGGDPAAIELPPLQIRRP